MKTQASLLAIKVSEFIKYNSIDVNLVPMETIVKEYFQAQMKAIDDAAIQAFNGLI